MALPTVCFANSQTQCNCTSPPPQLPPRPDFCVDGTTTTEPPSTTTPPSTPTDTAPTITTGLIVGCTCGAVIFIVLCGFLIWWLWKKGMFCFRPQGNGGTNGSEQFLAGNEEKQVELLNIKKGTVILKPPTTPPPARPEKDGPPPKPPVPNTSSDLTPVERSREVEASPSPPTEGRPDSSTSKKKKKKKKSNRVSPEPNPKPETLNL